MSDLIKRLREYQAQKRLREYQAQIDAAINRWLSPDQPRNTIASEAADEIERQQCAGAWCVEHQPRGGARGQCVICSGIKLQAALSRISYLCGEPNEMQCGDYDMHHDEDAVVAQVERLTAERDALRADAERYRWLRDAGNETWAPLGKRPGVQFTYQVDAAIDAERKEKP